MSFLVYSEDRELAFQILAKARELADAKCSEVVALVTDGSPQDYINQGADRALSVDGLGSFAVASAISRMRRSLQPGKLDAMLRSALRRRLRLRR